jgi:hypothetical protein
MLKVVFFLGLAVGLIIGAFYVLGYTLAFIFICLAKLFDWLNQAYSWAKTRWNERSAKSAPPEDLSSVATSSQQAPSPEVTPEPQAARVPDITADEVIVALIEAETEPVIVIPEQIALLPAKDEPEAKVTSVEVVADVPAEPAKPIVPEEPQTEPTPEQKAEPVPGPTSVQAPPPVAQVEPTPSVSPPQRPQVEPPRVPQSSFTLPVVRKPLTPPASSQPRPPSPSTPSRLPDFVGMGRRQFRVRLEDDPSGRPGKVIVCQMLGVFSDGFKGPARITVTAQELRDSKHYPLIRLGNPDFDPANPDVVHDLEDGVRFGFRDWTTVGRINLNGFQGYGTGDSEIEVTCRGFELRDGGVVGNLLFEETQAGRVNLVTEGYFVRKQRRVEHLKSVVIALRLFLQLDGGARNVTNALNRHFDSVCARFNKRWIGKDIPLLQLMQSEFTRHLPSNKTPADVVAEAGLPDAPKDLRNWLLREADDMLAYKPANGEAVRQAAALSNLLGGP